MDIFGLWEEAGVPGGNPRKHGGNMQSLHRKAPAGVWTRNLLTSHGTNHQATELPRYVIPSSLTILKQKQWWLYHDRKCPQGTVHNEVVITMGCCQTASSSLPFCDSSSLSVSLLQPADATLSCGNFPLRTSCLIPRSGQVLLRDC